MVQTQVAKVSTSFAYRKSLESIFLYVVLI